LPQRIAQDADDLGAAAWLAAAHAAFVDAHVGETLGGFGIRGRPADRLADAIDFLLVVTGDLLHRLAGVVEQALGELSFLRGNAAWCHEQIMGKYREGLWLAALPGARVLRCRYGYRGADTT